MNSCIYQGRVRHRRFVPRRHEFSYRLFLMYLDLDELDELFNRYWCWSSRRPAIAWFNRDDHLGDRQIPLKQSVGDLVWEITGRRPRGPIRLLTHLRYFGYGFNPVSFYYCFDPSGEQLETIVAEVNNTPWGEQYCYVLASDRDIGAGSHKRYKPTKQFHVSPFMPMDIDYDWRFSQPADRLHVHMANHRQGQKIFDATLQLGRKPISSLSLSSALIRFPLITVKVVFGIYTQALLLWLKSAPFYPHPRNDEAPHSAS
jgi:DUF1365 family protein